jgi:hypothetical protein
MQCGADSAQHGTLWNHVTPPPLSMASSAVPPSYVHAGLLSLQVA